MLHELGTNSVKYGSLSTARGTVTASWSVTDDVLQFHWVERGGPAVSAPIKRGFGTRLIEQSAKGEGGTAQMLSEAEGVTWQIVLPLPSSSVSQTPNERAEAQWINPAMRKYDGGLSAKHRAPLAGRRLLVVEDEPLIALDLAASLEKAGAALAKTAGTEKEALQLIEQTQFDGVLLDANLHGQTVDEIAVALTRRNIPFVFVTGYGRDGLPSLFKHAPILTKPFSDEQLLQAVMALPSMRHNVVQMKP
jgi:CheY-like chemotaxis protein